MDPIDAILSIDDYVRSLDEVLTKYVASQIASIEAVVEGIEAVATSGAAEAATSIATAVGALETVALNSILPAIDSATALASELSACPGVAEIFGSADISALPLAQPLPGSGTGGVIPGGGVGAPAVPPVPPAAAPPGPIAAPPAAPEPLPGDVACPPDQEPAPEPGETVGVSQKCAAVLTAQAGPIAEGQMNEAAWWLSAASDDAGRLLAAAGDPVVASVVSARTLPALLDSLVPGLEIPVT